MNDVVLKVKRALRFAFAILFAPWRLFMSIRRSMTGASVTLLLTGIVALNIVWGYPWVGMFAASVSLMVVGWTVSRVMRPRLRVSFSLPTSSPAGEAFSVNVHLQNDSSLPAMDMGFKFARSAGVRRASKRRGAVAEKRFRSLTAAQFIDLIHPSERVELSTRICFDRRGIHELPDVVITSTFPFHLFRSSRIIPSNTAIAITPCTIGEDEDAYSRGVLMALGGWSHRLLAGDALDYTGSREYQHGMSVRKWDFASWARLGRPIVREFQSPSIQTVTMIVDVSPETTSAGEQAMDDAVERLLSVAATAIGELAGKLVRLQMYVTHESPASFMSAECNSGMLTDSESLLIRLAAAECVAPKAAEARVAPVLEHVSRSPVLVLTCRPSADIWQRVAATVTVLRMDSPHTQPEPASSKRINAWARQPCDSLATPLSMGGS